MKFGKNEVNPVLVTKVTGTIKEENERAILFSNGRTETWVPKMFIEKNLDGSIMMPTWMARGKGFI